MVDENGGNIVWVQRAFGPFLGWVNAFNYLVSAFASMSLYPILVIDYLPQHWQVRFLYILQCYLNNKLFIIYIIYILA